jgi:hypothetical protein
MLDGTRANAADWLAEVQEDPRCRGSAPMACCCAHLPAAANGHGLTTTGGCHDARCQTAYAEAGGSLPLPKGTNQRDPRVREFLAWRAGLEARRVKEWAAFARELNPAIAILTENCGLARPGMAVGGEQSPIDGESEQSALLVPGDIPHLEFGQRLVQNAVGLGIALSGSDSRSVFSHVVSKTSEADTTWPEHRLGVAIGEACAVGARRWCNSGYVYRRNLTLPITVSLRRAAEAARTNGWLAAPPAGGIGTNASPGDLLFA